jgi:hypothetical protein
MIRFDYRLRSHGWAVAVIGDDHAEVSVPASYLSDALGDFVDTVRRVFATERAECHWQIEPGQFCWRLQRTGPRCVVEVLRNNEEQAIFSGSDDLLHFGSEVESTLQKLLTEWGEERYLTQWGHEFPHEAHRKLTQALKIERNVRETASRNSRSDC